MFVTLIGCVLFVISLVCFENFCLFIFALNVFTFFFLSIFTCFCVKNPKTNKKYKIQKVWLALLCNVTCIFCLVPSYRWLCAFYECSLFFMHSYHCGKNLDIYVTVVNRSSNLSWMISQWFCWSWDLHRLMPIYLPTLLFLFFLCLKSSINVNLKMKRDNELQKPLHILVFD